MQSSHKNTLLIHSQKKVQNMSLGQYLRYKSEKVHYLPHNGAY